MYVDSSQNEGPDSMQAVARLLREHLEPLLEVFNQMEMRIKLVTTAWLINCFHRNTKLT